MSTDITVTTSARRLHVSFDAFAQRDVREIQRAVVLVLGDTAATTERATGALSQLYRDWKQIGFGREPEFQLYGRIVEGEDTGSLAKEQLVPTQSLPSTSVLHGLSRTERATAVGLFFLRWAAPDVATSLQIDLATVNANQQKAMTHLDAYIHAHPARFERDGQSKTVATETLWRSLLQQETQAQSLPRLDVESIKNETRRRRLRIRTAITLVGLAALAMAGSFVAKTNGGDPLAQAEATVLPTATIQRPTPPSESPQVPVLRAPELVSVDEGGFAGAISSTGNVTALASFVTSDNGLSWFEAGEWVLDDDEEITRFERVSNRYVSWVGRTHPDPTARTLKLGISYDLKDWTTFLVPIGVAPDGLIYRSEIVDVAVNGPHILALVSTSTELDYAQLALVESNTCGSTITEEGATVNLCNQALLDVFSAVELADLPAANQLYLSSSGGPFEPVSAPFGEDVTVMLTSTNGDFGITNDTGLEFATSPDGRSWQTSQRLERTPESVRAAATNEAGDIVGLTVGTRGPALLFRGLGQQTEAFIVSELIGEQREISAASIETGEAGWVADLRSDQGESWLLHSHDGVQWRLVEAPPPGSGGRKVYVGDDELLLQFFAPTNGVFARIPLDAES